MARLLPYSSLHHPWKPLIDDWLTTFLSENSIIDLFFDSFRSSCILTERKKRKKKKKLSKKSQNKFFCLRFILEWKTRGGSLNEKAKKNLSGKLWK